MTRLFTILFLAIATSAVFGQKLKKAIFYLDAQEIKYKTFQKLLEDKTFEQINTIPGTKETQEIFGERAKNGVVHLKTSKFILRQDSLITSLKKEFVHNGTETKMVVINGLPLDRNESLEKTIINMDDKTIKWIFIPDNTDIFYPNKRVKFIQTNKKVEVPSR